MEFKNNIVFNLSKIFLHLAAVFGFKMVNFGSLSKMKKKLARIDIFYCLIWLCTLSVFLYGYISYIVSLEEFDFVEYVIISTVIVLPLEKVYLACKTSSFTKFILLWKHEQLNQFTVSGNKAILLVKLLFCPLVHVSLITIGVILESSTILEYLSEPTAIILLLKFH